MKAKIRCKTIMQPAKYINQMSNKTKNYFHRCKLNGVAQGKNKENIQNFSSLKIV